MYTNFVLPLCVHEAFLMIQVCHLIYINIRFFCIFYIIYLSDVSTPRGPFIFNNMSNVHKCSAFDLMYWQIDMVIIIFLSLLHQNLIFFLYAEKFFHMRNVQGLKEYLIMFWHHTFFT